jgi:hypothetical protein
VAFAIRLEQCGLKNEWAGQKKQNKGTISGVMPKAPSPPPSPAPTPPPVPAGTQKNIVFILVSGWYMCLQVFYAYTRCFAAN